MSIRMTSGFQPRRLLDRLLPVAGFPHELEVGLPVEDHPQPRQHEGLIVDGQHPDHCSPPSGRVALTSKPPFRGPASKAPPRSPTRSSSPISP